MRRPRGTGRIYRQKDSSIWWIKFYRNGEPFRESTGTPEKRKATRALNQRLAEVITGKFVGPYVERVPITELAADVLRDYRINGKTSIDDAEARWRLHLEPFFGSLRATLAADFDSTGLTLGPHPMAYRRSKMNTAGITPAADLNRMQDGTYVRIAGALIARQRPGTAAGFIFISLEDETGISNAIIHPDLYERNRAAVTRGKFLHVEGELQNRDGVINVRASAVHVLKLSEANVRSQ